MIVETEIKLVLSADQVNDAIWEYFQKHRPELFESAMDVDTTIWFEYDMTDDPAAGLTFYASWKVDEDDDN